MSVEKISETNYLVNKSVCKSGNLQFLNFNKTEKMTN